MRYQYPLLNAEMPCRDDVLALAPSQAVPLLAEHLTQCGLTCFLDRSDAQQRLCAYGLDGTCCRRCLWGPCRVSEDKPGICGAGPALVVLSNHLRMVAAAAASHGSHAKARLEALLAVGEGRAPGPIRGVKRVEQLASALGVPLQENGSARPAELVAGDLARLLYEDLGKARPGPMHLLEALAPPECVELWRGLEVMPTSTMSEVFEALHRTGLGADSDWRNAALHELRLAVAFFWGAVVVASLASEMLYGPPVPAEGEVGYGTLADGQGVKIAVHGHQPGVAEAVLAACEEPELLAEARSTGASGFDVYGLCCTGQELLARHGVPSLTGILGQELALATGALDALVVDLQCVIPGVMPIAEAQGTAVITTHDSNRLEGAVHVPFDVEDPQRTARAVLRLAIEAHGRRSGARRYIPATRARARTGFDEDGILAAFGGEEALLSHMRGGDIRGLVTMVSCNSPKVPYERSNVVLARELLRRGILITTTGCAAHALLNDGLASSAAREVCSPGLRRALERADLPPVLTVGACVDNTRTFFLWQRLAAAAGVPLWELPLFYVGAEPGNEKAVGMGMAFLAHGVSVLAGYPLPVPVPTARPTEGGALDDLVRVANPVADFFASGVAELLHARIVVEPIPELAAGAIQADFKRKRQAQGW